MRRYHVKENPFGSAVARSFATNKQTDRHRSPLYYRLSICPSVGKNLYLLRIHAKCYFVIMFVFQTYFYVLCFATFGCCHPCFLIDLSEVEGLLILKINVLQKIGVKFSDKLTFDFFVSDVIGIKIDILLLGCCKRFSWTLIKVILATG